MSEQGRSEAEIWQRWIVFAVLGYGIGGLIFMGVLEYGGAVKDWASAEYAEWTKPPTVLESPEITSPVLLENPHGGIYYDGENIWEARYLCIDMEPGGRGGTLIVDTGGRYREPKLLEHPDNQLPVLQPCTQIAKEAQIRADKIALAERRTRCAKDPERGECRPTNVAIGYDAAVNNTRIGDGSQ